MPTTHAATLPFETPNRCIHISKNLSSYSLCMSDTVMPTGCNMSRGNSCASAACIQAALMQCPLLYEPLKPTVMEQHCGPAVVIAGSFKVIAPA